MANSECGEIDRKKGAGESCFLMREFEYGESQNEGRSFGKDVTMSKVIGIGLIDRCLTLRQSMESKDLYGY